jgi:hypothetical protein
MALFDVLAAIVVQVLAPASYLSKVLQQLPASRFA